MSGSRICSDEVDSRACLVAATERRSRDMFEGKEPKNQAWLEEKARTVYSVYIPSMLGRIFFFEGNFGKAVEFLRLGAGREKNPSEIRLLNDEIKEAEAKL